MLCMTSRRLLAKRQSESLPLQEEEALSRHLDACAGCRAEEAGLRRIQDLVRSSHAGHPEPVRVDTAAILRQGRLAPRTGWGDLARPPRPALVLAGALLVGVPALWAWLRPGASLTRVSPAAPPGAGGAAAPERNAESAGRRTTGGYPSASTSPAPGAEPEAGRRTALRRPLSPGKALAGSPGGRSRRRVSGLPEVITRKERPVLPRPEPLSGQPAPVALQTREPEVTGPGESLPAAAARPGAVLAVAFAPVPPEPGPPGKVDPALRDDARLRARLSLAEKDRPLGELLPALGKRLGVRLVADRTVADDKATLFLEGRSAGEGLTLLARHLGFQWLPTRGGYELAQDLGGRRREQALLRNELEPVEAQLNLASRLLGRPADWLRQRIEELDGMLAGAGLQPDERARLQAEKQITLDVALAPAIVEASLALFRGLTPAQIDSLFNGSEIRYSTANETLPPAIAARVHEATSILEHTYGPLPKLQADATVRLTDVPDEDEIPPPRRNRQLRLQCTTATLRGTMERPHNWGGGWSPEIPHLEEHRSALAPGAASDPDLKREMELTLPGPERQPARFNGGSQLSLAHTGALWPGQATLAEIAAAIHRSTGLEVVADSFVSARLDPALLRGRRPLLETLEILARELDYTWEKRGGLLLLRNRRFYRDRPAEVPERILRPFREGVLREGALSLDALAGLAAALSDAQARSMYRYWGWYLEGTGIMPTDWFFPYRQYLRFWNALSPAQRQAARAGSVLPVSGMTPLQRQLWSVAIASPPESARTPSTERRIPTAEAMAAGAFSLKSTEVQSVLFVRTTLDGKSAVAHGLNVEGPPTLDVLKFAGRANGPNPPGMGPDVPQPQLSLLGHAFRFHVGGEEKPVREVRILLAPLRRKPAGEPSKKAGEE